LKNTEANKTSNRKQLLWQKKTINTIDDTIALLRTGPSLFIVTDPDTGETRRAVGRDIDDLKALKADILKKCGFYRCLFTTSSQCHKIL